MSELGDLAGSVSVLVSSCDAFLDVWRPFAFFFRKFWPDCPFPIHLVVNELEIHSQFIRALPVGKDRGWATNLQRALPRIDTPYVLYFQEDYFLTSAVDEAQLARDFEYAFGRRATSLCFRDLARLEAWPARSDDRIRDVPADSTGRTRLQATLWEKEALAALLRSGETAWEMETRGSERTLDLTMLCYARNEDAPLQYLMSAIVRGLWTEDALALCRAHGLEIQPHFRRQFVPGKLRRRWNRARSRSALALSLALQRGHPVELD